MILRLLRVNPFLTRCPALLRSNKETKSLSTKTKLNILHTADWHLCVAKYGSLARGRDYFESARNLIMTAAEYATGKNDGAPFVMVCCGDITSQKELASGIVSQLDELNALAVEKNLLVLTIMGNHDEAHPPWCARYNEQTARDGMRRGFFDITSTSVEDVLGTGTTIRGVPMCPSLQLPEVLSSQEPAEIMLWHGGVRDFVGYPTETLCCLDDLTQTLPSECAALLLGDIHVRMFVDVSAARGTRQTLVGYPGSSELESRSEPLEKSFTHIRLKYNNTAEVVDHVPFPAPRPIVVWNAGTDGQVEEVIRRVRELIEQGQKPLALINYLPSLTGAKDRIQSEIPVDKCLLRVRPDPNAASTDTAWIMAQNTAERLRNSGAQLRDVLLEMLQNDSERMRLADAMMADTQKAGAMAEAYIHDTKQ
jgi:hypothetical protein